MYTQVISPSTQSQSHRDILFPTVFIDERQVVCFLQHKADETLNCLFKRYDENDRKWLILQSDGSFFHLFAKALCNCQVQEEIREMMILQE